MEIFISSVVSGFENYRAVARKAVKLLGHQPVMCEDFGARPYSSEVACMTEVDHADVVIVILGAEFGFATENGLSVTQQEFRRAVAGGKKVLAFLQDLPVEGAQQDFCREISDYVDGLFRVTFTNEQELSDGIVQALNQLNTKRNTISEEEFALRISKRQEHGQWRGRSHEARFELSFLPQPELSGSLRRAHAEHDEFFLKACQAGLSSLKDGYTDFDQDDLTGIDMKSVSWRHHDCGLSWLSVALTTTHSNENFLSSYYVSPLRVRSIADAAFGLINQGKGGWFQLGLYNVGQKLFQEPPTRSTHSVIVPRNSEHTIEFRKLLIPASASDYQRWLDDAMFRIGRKLSV